MCIAPMKYFVGTLTAIRNSKQPKHDLAIFIHVVAQKLPNS